MAKGIRETASEAQKLRGGIDTGTGIGMKGVEYDVHQYQDCAEMRRR